MEIISSTIKLFYTTYYIILENCEDKEMNSLRDNNNFGEH